MTETGGGEEGLYGGGSAETDEELDEGEMDKEVGVCVGFLEDGLGVDGVDVVGDPPDEELEGEEEGGA